MAAIVPQHCRLAEEETGVTSALETAAILHGDITRNIEGGRPTVTVRPPTNSAVVVEEILFPIDKQTHDSKLGAKVGISPATEKAADLVTGPEAT